jgi:hypothetical protein
MKKYLCTTKKIKTVENGVTNYAGSLVKSAATLALPVSFIRLRRLIWVTILLSLPLVGTLKAQVSGPPDVTVDSSPVDFIYMVTGYSGYTAQWGGSGVQVMSGQNGQVSGAGARASLKFTLVGSVQAGCCLQGGPCGSQTVNVHPKAPTILSDPTPIICNGGVVNINAGYSGTMSGTTSFRWYLTASGGSPFATTSGTLQQTITSSITYYVATYNTIGGESLTRTSVPVTAATPPTSTPGVTPVVGIYGGQVTLTATGGASGISYKWTDTSGNSTTTSTNQTTVTVPSASTTNFRSVRFAIGPCEGPVSWIPITVYSRPVISGAGPALGEPGTLTCNAEYDTYTWYVQGNATPVYTSSGPQDNTFTNPMPGAVYTVLVTKNGASAQSQPFMALGSQFEGQNENYIITNTIQVKSVTTQAGLDALTRIGNTQTIQYFDGLGRPMQTVSTQGSPSGNDMVQPVVYDAFGREARKYLPVVPKTRNGGYKAGIIGVDGNYTRDVASFYSIPGDAIADDGKPYAETIFEPSPLNRVLRQGASGTDWQPSASGTYADPAPFDHSVKMDYAFNGVNEVLLLDYDAETRSIGSGSSLYYAVNQLRVNKTKDEQNHEVIEYIDKEGQTVLKKLETLENGVKTYAETYYIYDDFGNLVVVLPPEASKRIKTLFGGQP